MAVAGLVAAALLGLVVLLLAVPVGVAFRLDGLDPPDGAIAVRWAFGLVRFRIPLRREGGAEREEGEARAGRRRKGRKERRERKKRGKGGRGALAVLRQEAFRQRVLRLVRDLLRALHARDLYLRMRLGTGDPADTGRLWALLWPVALAAEGLRGADLRIEPEFMEPCLELRARGVVRVVPLQVVAIAVAFALSPPSLRAWRTLWEARA